MFISSLRSTLPYFGTVTKFARDMPQRAFLDATLDPPNAVRVTQVAQLLVQQVIRVCAEVMSSWLTCFRAVAIGATRGEFAGARAASGRSTRTACRDC